MRPTRQNNLIQKIITKNNGEFVTITQTFIKRSYINHLVLSIKNEKKTNNIILETLQNLQKTYLKKTKIYIRNRLI